MEEQMIKLLIVDDEEEIREGIQQVVPWKDYGVTVIGLAANGQDALLQIEQKQPDIILLDIRMPIMNGLELLEKLASYPVQPHVIILSGYDDFSYCQKAIKNGAADYLLKPCKPSEIVSAVNKLKELIFQEEKDHKILERLRSQFRENLNLLREKLVLYLVRTEQPDREVGLEKWRLYELNISPNNIGVALIRIDRNGYSGEDLELRKFAVYNQVVHQFTSANPNINCFICDYNDDLLILWDFGSPEITSARKCLDNLRKTIENEYSFTVTIGLGIQAATFADLCQSYTSALMAVEDSFWLGTNRIIDYQELESPETYSTNFPTIEESTILHCLRTNDQERMPGAIEAYFSSVLNDCEAMSKPGKEYLLKVITALFCSIYHICVERGLPIESVFGSDLSFLDKVHSVETIDNLKQMVTGSLNQIIALSPTHKNSWKVVNKALLYIDKHFEEELNLEIVAQKVYVSPGYLSTLFKQELNKNFLECLHEVRINKAKSLLREDYLKIYEVAFRVGYHDEKYFSQIFKKFTGLSPNQYRETIKSL